MFTLLSGKTVEQETDRVLSKKLLGFFSSREIVAVLPRVSKTMRDELATTYAQWRTKAQERVLIFKRTLSPSLRFPLENPDSFDYLKLAGGYSNATFKIKLRDGQAFVSRIAGAGSESVIDRHAEWHNASIAAELSLNPAIVYNDKLGSQLSDCLLSPQALTPELLQQAPKYLQEVATQLRTLHQSPKKFHNDVNIFKQNARFYGIIEQSGLKLPDEYTPIREASSKLADILEQLEIPSVPCHNDTFYNNFLINDGQLWLIDWEYSGNHDPIWDLAYFSKLAHLTTEQNTALLTAYFDSKNFEQEHPLEYLRFLAYSIVINDFLILWSFVQRANKNKSATEEELDKWVSDALCDGMKILESEVFNNAVLRLEEATEPRLTSAQ
jgi:thiamine kinase-like enzyme